jgi:hypothetical protein
MIASAEGDQIAQGVVSPVMVVMVNVKACRNGAMSRRPNVPMQETTPARPAGLEVPVVVAVVPLSLELNERASYRLRHTWIIAALWTSRAERNPPPST